MCYSTKIPALAAVAVLLASGLFVVAGDNDIAVADSTNTESFSVQLVHGDTNTTYSGAWALSTAVSNYEEGDVIEVLSSGDANGLFIGTNADGSHYVIVDGTSAPIDSGVKTIVVDFKCEVMNVITNVGSTGTVSQAFHLEKDINVILENGEIKASGDKFAMLVQNYCNLTLDNMVLDGTGMTRGGDTQSKYTLSNNYGDIKIKGTTRILASTQGTATNYAVDVYHYLPYYVTAPVVTFEDDFNGIIEGNVSLYGAVTLNVNGKGTFCGSLEKSGESAPITDINSGLFLSTGSWIEAGSEDYSASVTCGTFYGCGSHVAEYKVSEQETNSFPSLYSAVMLQDTDGVEPISMVADDSGAGLFISEPLTIDFGGYTYDVTAMTVGSAGTETQALHIEVPSPGKVVLKNGTLTATGYSKMLVQNYSALEIDNMTLDGSKLVQGHKASDETQYVDVYTLSNNNADVVLKDSVIIAKQGVLESYKTAFAFDICASSSDCTVTVEGKVTVKGSIEASGSSNPTLVLDGTIDMIEGSLGTSSTAVPVIVNENGKLIANTDCSINANFTSGDSDSADVIVKNVVAGENKISVEHGSVKIVGDLMTNETGTVEVLTNNVEMAGNVGYNVTVKIPTGVKVALADDLSFDSGSKLQEADVNSFVATSEAETADVVMEVGSTLKSGTMSETIISDKIVEQFDDSGESPTIMLRATFVIADSHVKSVSYDGKPYYEDAMTESGIVLELGDIDVTVDDGYKVTGWVVDGVVYDANDTVTITENCDVFAIVDEEQSSFDSGTIVAITLVTTFAFVGFLVTCLTSRE